jgi:hypothetical protein
MGSGSDYTTTSKPIAHTCKHMEGGGNPTLNLLLESFLKIIKMNIDLFLR